MATIGENIKNLREKNGWSQAELASKIGKTRSAISQYEHNETTPRMGVIEDLARVFGVKKRNIIEQSVTYAVVSLDDGLSEDEKELVRLFRQMPNKGKAALLAGLHEYVKENK